jgi:hypothetical protein
LRTDNQPSYASTGYYFFRNEFTLSEFTPVTFTVTGDNFLTLFLEGVPILGESPKNADSWLWQGWMDHQIWLPAGTYTVAAVVYNIAFSDMGASPPYPDQPPCPAEGFAGGPRDDNAGGLLFAAFIDGGFGEAPEAILMSDDSWIGFYDPTTWPGWTPGQIIQQLIDEAIIQGSITVFDNGGSVWDADDDSNGDPWRPLDPTVDRPDIPMFPVDVGSSLMSALYDMHEQGWIRWHGQPGTFILDIYRGRLPTPSSSASLVAGVNLMALERSSTTPYANALLVQWESGFEPVEDAAAVTSFGTKVERLYASDAPSKEEAISQGDTELIRTAQQGFPAITAVVEPTSTADCPYEAFGISDYVTIPAIGGGTEDVRCLSIACQQDNMGYAVWTLELNQKLDVPERRSDELLQSIGGRNQVLRGVVHK